MLTIRLSKSEQQELKKRAAKVGLSVGAFLIGAALGEITGKALADKICDLAKKDEP